VDASSPNLNTKHSADEEQMNLVTLELHRNLLRALKAAIAAWERWLQAQEGAKK